MNKRICAFLLALVLFVSQFPAELAAESRELIEEMGNSWTFDAYYSGEDDKYDVEKDDDFNLKYQLEFHTNKDQPAGTVKMRIQRSVFVPRRRPGFKRAGREAVRYCCAKGIQRREW